MINENERSERNVWWTKVLYAWLLTVHAAVAALKIMINENEHSKQNIYDKVNIFKTRLNLK